MMYDGYGMMPGSGAMLVLGVVFLIPFWRICAKAGYPGWLSLLVLVPVANLLLLYYLGFSEWPLERRNAGDAPPR